MTKATSLNCDSLAVCGGTGKACLPRSQFDHVGLA